MLYGSLLVLAGSISFSWGLVLEPRSGTAQTAAVCSSDFAWTSNSKGISPCQLAADINSLCNNGNWIIPALNASVTYTNPTVAARTATFCTCSWASYNLLGACAACQDFTYEIPIWDTYNLGCGGLLSTTWFPQNITLPTGTVIPYWAAQDPTKWTNEQFNPTAAEAIASQGHPDLTNDDVVVHKSKPIGAIVGGVVGGIIVLVAAIVIGWYLIRIKHKGSKGSKLHTSSSDHTPYRSDSVGSKFKQWYTTSTSPMDTYPPTSPTIRTHGTSVLSQPFTSSVVASVAPYGTASPPPANREDVVVPFTLPPTNDNPDRKQSSGGFPVFDQPNAPPAGRAYMEVSPSTPIQQGRARFNPPTYADSQSPQSGSNTPSTSRRPHAKKGSTDTHDTISSPSPAPRHPGAHNQSGSISAMSNASATQMGTTEHASGNVTPAHGRQVSSGDEKRRPPDDSFSARDIA